MTGVKMKQLPPKQVLFLLNVRSNSFFPSLLPTPRAHPLSYIYLISQTEFTDHNKGSE